MPDRADTVAQNVGPFELSIVLLSAALHAGWSIAVKSSRDSVVFNLLQSGILCTAAIALLPFVDVSEIPAPVWRIAAMTGVAHALYLYWLSRALETADISLVYPIARSTPAFMPLVAVPLLGESVSGLGVLGIATVVVGIWLVSLGGRLNLRSFLQPGLVFAYLTLASTVAYGLFDKAAMTSLDAVTWTSAIPRPIFFFLMLYLASSVYYVPLALWRRGTSQIGEIWRTEWRSLLVSAVISLASYGFILEALRTAPASYVVAVRQSSVLFVLILSVLLLRERQGPARLLGAGITVAGVAVIAIAP